MKLNIFPNSKVQVNLNNRYYQDNSQKCHRVPRRYTCTEAWLSDNHQAYVIRVRGHRMITLLIDSVGKERKLTIFAEVFLFITLKNYSGNIEIT